MLIQHISLECSSIQCIVLIIIKEVEIILRKQVASYLAKKLLATHATLQVALTTICVCSCKYNSSWVYIVTSMHACTNETYSLAILLHLIQTLAGNTIQPKYGLNFEDLLEREDAHEA